jgi:hypothetical protein
MDDASRLPVVASLSRLLSMTNLCRLLGSWRLHIFLLVFLACSCWLRTIHNSFLADDYGEVRYVYRLFHGHPNYFLDNLFGPYMHNPTICVYRPFMLTTQIIDYAIWGPHAFGFYLSNLFYYLGDILLLYVFVRAAGAGLNVNEPALRTAALFSAALFALNPLHCESVSWMVGRVDVDCCFYYLLALVLLLRSAKAGNKFNWRHIVGLISFAFALGTKEMAVGLPLALTAAVYLFPLVSMPTHIAQFKDAMQRTWTAWALLATYLVVRSLALGTVLGGYKGSIGSLQASSAIAHWLDADTWHRIVMPVHSAIIPHIALYQQLLQFSICALAVIALVLLFAGNISMRWLAFIFIWAITTAAPVYQLWGLGPYLEGSRFLFFFSMPLCSLLPVLILATNADAASGQLSLLKTRLQIAAIIFFTTSLIALGHICYDTNLLWVHAGKEVSAVCKEAAQLAAEHPGKKIILLGIPDDNSGAHEIINANVFQQMLQPPFSPNIADRFLVFSRLCYEPSQYINNVVFKQALSNPQNFGPYMWSRRQQKFVLIRLVPSAAAANTEQPLQIESSAAGKNTVKLVDIKSGEGFHVNGLHINPLTTDYLEFEYRNDKGSGVIPCRVFWNPNTNTPAADSLPSALDSRSSDMVFLPCSVGKCSHAQIKLSRYWQWFTAPEIQSLYIMFGSFPDIEVKNARVCSGQSLQPVINAVNCTLDLTAVYSLPNNGIDLQLTAPASAPSSTPRFGRLQIEVSQPNFFFDPLAAAGTACAKTKTINLPANSTHLDPSFFPQNGYYQIRAVYLDSHSKQQKEYSDPITICKNASQ